MSAEKINNSVKGQKPEKNALCACSSAIPVKSNGLPDIELLNPPALPGGSAVQSQHLFHALILGGGTE
jgi:hypothetical protein